MWALVCGQFRLPQLHTLSIAAPSIYQGTIYSSGVREKTNNINLFGIGDAHCYIEYVSRSGIQNVCQWTDSSENNS